MKNQTGFALTELLVVAFWLLVIGGWVANIVKLIGMIGADEITTMFIARCVGVLIAPFGAILGFF